MEMNLNKYYKLPLKLDPEPYCVFAWTRDSNTALMFEEHVDRELAQNIVDAINGTKEFHIDDLDFCEDEFTIFGEPLFCVRGWGNLTAPSSHNLSWEEATKVQDAFVDFIYQKLSVK